MATLEQSITAWLEEHCVDVTSVTAGYVETTITGAVTAQYQVGIESGITEDLDAVAVALLPDVANCFDLDPDSTYSFLLTQSGEGSVEYHFSGTSTKGGSLDQVDKVA